MRDRRSCPDEPIRPTTAEEDRRTRHSVLIAVIDLHPAPVTVSELIRQLTRTSEDFGECDAIEQAVLDLAGFGLLHRHDSVSVPTPSSRPPRRRSAPTSS